MSAMFLNFVCQGQHLSLHVYKGLMHYCGPCGQKWLENVYNNYFKNYFKIGFPSLNSSVNTMIPVEQRSDCHRWWKLYDDSQCFRVPTVQSPSDPAQAEIDTEILEDHIKITRSQRRTGS